MFHFTLAPLHQSLCHQNRGLSLANDVNSTGQDDGGAARVKELTDSQTDSDVSSIHLTESQVVSEALFAVYVITQGCLQSTRSATQLLVYQV